MIDPHDIHTYDDLRKHLGHVIPCYDATWAWTGCHADDDTNEKVCCETGCLLLDVYRKGFRAGRDTNSTKGLTAEEDTD